MAGMFYSLQEVIEKLNKTEQEVKEIVKEGKLREFRDGPNLLFKVDEVEALMSDTSIMASQEASAPSEQAPEEEISLAPEPIESPAAGSELTDADTAITGEGVDVLGGTDSGYQLADDTKSETKAASDEASLEEIEEDVNLDTFGSGSGLLDLSLQADDTSLGGILDEIYTPEGGEGEEAPEAGSAVEVAADAEQMLPEEQELAGPEPAPEVPAVAQAYIEPQPDLLSNIFGIMLFLPLLAFACTAIAAVAGQRGMMPSVLTSIQGLIWPLVIGGWVVTGLIVGATFMLGNKGAKVGKKQKAEKTPPPQVETPEDETV